MHIFHALRWLYSRHLRLLFFSSSVLHVSCHFVLHFPLHLSFFTYLTTIFNILLASPAYYFFYTNRT
jgi:hypothetical protein